MSLVEGESIEKSSSPPYFIDFFSVVVENGSGSAIIIERLSKNSKTFVEFTSSSPLLPLSTVRKLCFQYKSIYHQLLSKLTSHKQFSSRICDFDTSESDCRKILFMSFDQISIELKKWEQLIYCNFMNFFDSNYPINYIHEKLIFLN